MKHKFSTILHYVDPLAPRWHVVAGQWVKHEAGHQQDTNPEYVSVPYKVLSWNPEKGFTTHASNS